MKSKPRQMATYSSLLSEYKTSKIKTKQIKIPTAKYHHSYSSLNKSSHSVNKQPKNSTYSNSIKSLIKKCRPQTATEDNKIDIKISVNYQKDTKPIINKTKQIQYHHHNNNNNNIHTRNISESNFYQNNLNISLTNYTQPNKPTHVHTNANEQHINNNNINNNTLMYHITEPQITIEELEEIMHTPETTNISNNNIVFSAINVNEFTLNNTNSRTAKFSAEINQATIAFIKNSLSEGLSTLNNDTKTKYKDKELYDSSNMKYELYKNALIQLGGIGSNEEEIELIKMITNGISDLITFYHNKKEEMNKSYSDLFHKYIDTQKDNQNKSKRLKMLKKKIDALYHKKTDQSQSNTPENVHIKKRSESIGYEDNLLLDSKSDYLNEPHRHIHYRNKTENDDVNCKKRTKIKENNYWNDDSSINDLDSIYFSNKIPQTFSISYCHIPKLDLNFSTWKWKNQKNYPNQLHQFHSNINLTKNNLGIKIREKNKKTLINKIQNKSKTKGEGRLGVAGGEIKPHQNKLHSFLKLSEICNGNNHDKVKK